MQRFIKYKLETDFKWTQACFIVMLRCINAIYLPWIDKIRPSQSSFLNCIQILLPAAGLPLTITFLKELCSTNSFCKTSSPLFTQLDYSLCYLCALWQRHFTLKKVYQLVLKTHIQIWSIQVINMLENWRLSHLNVGFCTLSLCFLTKMLMLDAQIFH